MPAKKNIIAHRLYAQGYFSEYLPFEFSTKDFIKLKNLSIETTNKKPFSYTMNKNEKFQDRRIISIPEIGSYINAVKHIISSDILSEIIILNESNDKTLSKFFLKDGDIRTFANPYSKVINSDKKINQDFISNTILKLKKSIGSVGILKLDIANFYGSFYTHNITCIGKSSEWAEKNFQLDPIACDPKYTTLRNLDKVISNLNQKRTHGLLMGPLLSYIVAEGMMCTIDGELTRELEDQLEKKLILLDLWMIMRFLSKKKQIMELLYLFSQKF
ncbi:MAG: hypothetical protein RBQ97_06510 [Acholeplasma sp.]|nr:hypothetical protein [Acholeplasma sp.]